MSTVTTYLNLVKPATLEQYSLATMNNNLDLIDAASNTTNVERKKLRHAEYTGGATAYPSSAAQWGVGVLSVDAAIQLNNTFAQYLSSDTIKILETGVYQFSWLLYSTSLPPNGEVIIKNTTTGVILFNDDLSQAVSWTVPSNATAYVSANDSIAFYTINRSGAFTASSRIKVTKLQGM